MNITRNFSRSMAAAIAETRPPPCEQPYRCANYDRCACEYLACTLFAAYCGLRQTRRPLSKSPSRGIYDYVFRLDDEEFKFKMELVK